MTRTGMAVALAVMLLAGRSGVANAAPTFDVDGYSDCTVAAVPGPDQNYDALVTTCCVQHAGVPTDTRYGVGCVAPQADSSVGFRPTIVLPTRPVPPEENEGALDGLVELPAPFDEPAQQP